MTDSSAVPATTDLPTTPGSVIEARDSEGIACLMYRLDTESLGNQITGSWIDVTGCYWNQSDLTLIRVLYDAGADDA